MGILGGPFVVAALLLALAGGFKLARPGPAAAALRASGLAALAPLARLIGAGEVVAGAGALAAGTRPFAWAVAGCYAAFAGFVVLALGRGGPGVGCGCFGSAGAAPGPLHLAVDVAAAGVAVAVALGPGGGLGRALAGQALAGVPFAVLVVATTGLAYAVIGVLPRTLEEVRG